MLVVLALVASARRDDERGGTGGGDAGLAHVHGLGINPRDGALFAATHSGLFRIREGDDVRRIADRYQDTMGFTVVGPDHFLASGHPDIDETALRRPDRPPLLGLIESRDAGRTWRPLSLLGEADFHALVSVHDRVYGFDATSGRFMVSPDMRTWEARSTRSMFDFAVDPQNAERVIATTEEGVIESRDGGRSWSEAAPPRLVVLSWDATAGLWGAGADGRVLRLRPEGSWEQMGTVPGRPQALLVQGDRVHAAVEGTDGSTAVLASRDGSRWEPVFRGGPT